MSGSIPPELLRWLDSLPAAQPAFRTYAPRTTVPGAHAPDHNCDGRCETDVDGVPMCELCECGVRNGEHNATPPYGRASVCEGFRRTGRFPADE